MAYNIDWNIQFKTGEKRYKLALLAECEIFSSVNNLADTATIVLPEAVLNKVLNFENKIGRGSEVLIQFGYDGNLNTEFTGFIRDIVANDSSLKIECEDALFLFRKGVPDIVLKPTSIKKIAQYLIDNIDPSFSLNCTYDINYEKFTIRQATGFDVLKKLLEESKGNIYFDNEKKVLNIHPPYVEKTGEVYYSMQKNIETSSLEFKNKLDFKVEVTVESTDIKGNVKQITRGTTGGDKVTIKVGSMDESSMIKIAEAVLTKRSLPAYEGTFSAWLIPFVKPAMSARIKDNEYLDKTAFYYVASVRTSISQNGGEREITPTLKLT